MPQDAHVSAGIQQSGQQSMPTVIDLSSRIPARGGTPLATLVLANGRKVLVPEDDVRQPQTGRFAQFR